MKTPQHQSTFCVHFHYRPHRRRFKVLAALVAAALSLLPLGDAWAQSDNFNDGNDEGWTPYSPLAPYGVPGVFTFPSGGYRIQTTVATGDPQNPGRAGSLRQDVPYTDFYVAVDLVNWDADPVRDPAFGILARIENARLGETTGYALTYTSRGQTIDISRITGEAPSEVASSSRLEIAPGSYRLLFIGKGTVLTGRIYDLRSPDNPTLLAEITGADGSYSSGVCGLLVYDNSGGSGTADATFDNYVALPEEPPKLSYKYFESLEIEVTWPVTYTGYVLESSPVLPATTWTKCQELPRESEGVWVYLEDASPGTGNKFFRLRKPWPPGGAR